MFPSQGFKQAWLFWPIRQAKADNQVINTCLAPLWSSDSYSPCKWALIGSESASMTYSVIVVMREQRVRQNISAFWSVRGGVRGGGCSCLCRLVSSRDDFGLSRDLHLPQHLIPQLLTHKSPSFAHLKAHLAFSSVNLCVYKMKIANRHF